MPLSTDEGRLELDCDAPAIELGDEIDLRRIRRLPNGHLASEPSDEAGGLELLQERQDLDLEPRLSLELVPGHHADFGEGHRCREHVSDGVGEGGRWGRQRQLPTEMAGTAA